MVDFFYLSTKKALSKKFSRKASTKICFLIFYMDISYSRP